MSASDMPSSVRRPAEPWPTAPGDETPGGTVIVEALRGTDRDSGLDSDWIRKISFYWEAVRGQYAAFENISMDEIYHLRPRMSVTIPCGDC